MQNVKYRNRINKSRAAGFFNKNPPPFYRHLIFSKILSEGKTIDKLLILWALNGGL